MRMIAQIPKSNSVDSQIIMRDFYENEFGIFPHFNPNKRRPLASVAIHPAEEQIDDSLLEEAIRSYTKRNIRDLYSLNIVEFLDLPMHVVNLLIKIADEAGSQKHQTAMAIERELNQSNR